MNKQPEPYKVGDTIYLKRYGAFYRTETITKITKTLIRSENYNYRKPSEGSTYLHITGQGGWQSMAGYLETPELKKEWQEVDRRRWLENNYKRISSQDIDMLRAKMRKRNKPNESTTTNE